MGQGVLPRQALAKLVRESPPLIEGWPDPEGQMQPCGIDLTVREVARMEKSGLIGSNAGRELPEAMPLPWVSEELQLSPGPYLITFNEIVRLPARLMALARSRSSLLRCGAALHSAVWDAGYQGRGQGLLVVYNPYGLRLQRDARICQLVFLALSEETDSTYAGKYQGQFWE